MTFQVSLGKFRVHALNDSNLYVDGKFVEANMLTPTKRIFSVEDPSLPLKV